MEKSNVSNLDLVGIAGPTNMQGRSLTRQTSAGEAIEIIPTRTTVETWRTCAFIDIYQLIHTHEILIHTHTHTYIHTHIYTHIYTHPYIHTHIYTHIIYTHIYTHVKHIPTHIIIYLNLRYVYIYIYIYIHI